MSSITLTADMPVLANYEWKDALRLSPNSRHYVATAPRRLALRLSVSAVCRD